MALEDALVEAPIAEAELAIDEILAVVAPVEAPAETDEAAVELLAEEPLVAEAPLEKTLASGAAGSSTSSPFACETAAVILPVVADALRAPLMIRIESE